MFVWRMVYLYLHLLWNGNNVRVYCLCYATHSKLQKNSCVCIQYTFVCICICHDIQFENTFLSVMPFGQTIPSPTLSPKMPPKQPPAHKRGLYFLFQNYPRNQGLFARQLRDNNCLAAIFAMTSRSLFWPTWKAWFATTFYGIRLFAYSWGLFAYNLSFLLTGGGTISRKDQMQFPDRGEPYVEKTKPIFHCKHKRPNRISTVRRKWPNQIPQAKKDQP